MKSTHSYANTDTVLSCWYYLTDTLIAEHKSVRCEQLDTEKFISSETRN